LRAGFFQCRELVGFVITNAGIELVLDAPQGDRMVQRNAKNIGTVRGRGLPGAGTEKADAPEDRVGVAGRWKKLDAPAKGSIRSTAKWLDAARRGRVQLRKLTPSTTLTMPRAALALLATFALGAPARADEAAFKAKVTPLVEAHCLGCHGPDTQKADLRLDTLKPDLTDARAAATWTRVYDKLASGEMPPKKRERPARADLDAATAALRTGLHAASLARQQKDGRVAVRRLNGTEYENTIRDLLGTRVRLKELLPEDNSAAGFDNVGAALDVSATHQLQYLEAAEKAVLSVVPPHPPVPFRDRRTGKEMTEKGPNFKQTLTRSCRLDGDALVIYSKLPRYGLCATAGVPAAGRYKVTMSIAAVGADGKAVPAAFMVVGTGREDPVLRDLRDIPPGKPTVVELDVDLERREAFVVNLLANWDIRATKKPIEEYTGPGLLVEWLQIEGPVGAFPPPSYDSLFAGVPLKPRSVAKAEAEGKAPPKIPAVRGEFAWANDPLVPASAKPKEDADRLMRAFLPRAFRRPVDEAAQKAFVAKVHGKLDAGYSFFDAMTYGYKSALASPHFLLLAEPTATGPKLDEYAVAARLSYFLWSTAPDAELLALAQKGELSKPAVLRAQVERMLKSPLAERFAENFVGQWLDLRKIDATIPDPHLYGDFDGTLLWAMPRETLLFFAEVLKNDRSLLEFVDSDWTMLNERLARHYGIAGVTGNEFRKVPLPPGSHRGGVMTHASVLKVTADGTRTSPVLRGKWVLEKIVGKPPAPPPPDVPSIEPDIRGATTIRQQLDKHRSVASCASCHVHIDPPGFALESFDPIGGWREFYRASARTPKGVVSLPGYTGRAFYRGPDVEKGGQTHDGRAFADIDEYKKLLLADKDQIARNLTEKLLVYATGADLQFADREEVERIVAALRGKNYGFRTLVHEVVQSRVFLNK
jgi:mono/diheme cytochrome c family protein